MFVLLRASLFLQERKYITKWFYVKLVYYGARAFFKFPIMLSWPVAGRRPLYPIIYYTVFYIYTQQRYLFMDVNIAWDHDWGKRHCTKYGRRNQVPISIKTNFFFFFLGFLFCFLWRGFFKRLFENGRKICFLTLISSHRDEYYFQSFPRETSSYY